MAKHRKASKLNPAVAILSLFLGVLFMLSLFSFTDLRNSEPIAIPPYTSQQVDPSSPGTSNAPAVPTSAQNTPQVDASSRAINAPVPTTAVQKVPDVQKNVIPTTNNQPPLPLPTVPPVRTTKPLLKLDNGLEVNVPLLDLGVTVSLLNKGK